MQQYESAMKRKKISPFHVMDVNLALQDQMHAESN